MAGAAWAADLPMKAPPPPMKAPFSWTGCYAGVNAGGASTKIDHDVAVSSAVTFDSSGRDSSFTGGGGLGCNYQFDPNWVVGLEGDINYLHASRNQNLAFRFVSEDTIATQESSLRWLATFRGRFGYAWDRWFFYGTGGLAIGDVKSSVSARSTNSGNPPVLAGSYSSTRTGWTAGVGVEHAFAERFSVKLEYLHFDLGTANYLVNQISGGATNLPSTWLASAKVSGDIIRVGLNYRFVP